MSLRPITDGIDALGLLRVGQLVYQRPDLASVTRYDRPPGEAGAVEFAVQAPGQVLGRIAEAPAPGRIYVRLNRPDGTPYASPVYFRAGSLAIDPASAPTPAPLTPAPQPLSKAAALITRLNEADRQVHELLVEADSLAHQAEGFLARSELRAGVSAAEMQRQVATARAALERVSAAYSARQTEKRRIEGLAVVGERASEYATAIYNWTRELFGLARPAIGALQLTLPVALGLAGAGALVGTAVVLLLQRLFTQAQGNLSEVLATKDTLDELIRQDVPADKQAAFRAAVEDFARARERAVKPGPLDGIKDVFLYLGLGLAAYLGYQAWQHHQTNTRKWQPTTA